jgi:membrane protease YdiL (CAAX protease family)
MQAHDTTTDRDRPGAHHATATDGLGLGALALFLLVTFGLAWGILALFIALPGPMTSLFGELTGNHPLFFLAVYAPAIGALVVVSADSGLAGLRRFLGRATRWRCSRAWLAFLLLGVPAVFYAGAAIKGTLRTDPWPLAQAGSPLLALLLAAIKGPVEEFGWRGLALPLLQRRLAPLWSSVILGAIWGVWHLPAFLLAGTQQSAWSFTPFLAGTIAISVIATALFNATRGSILLAAVLHFQLMNPIWPDAQPHDTTILLVVAAVLVWRRRRAMVSRSAAVTEIVPAGDPSATSSRPHEPPTGIPG